MSVRFSVPVTKSIAGLVASWYDVPLERLSHPFPSLHDQDTAHHRTAYAHCADPSFVTLYQRLVTDVVDLLDLDEAWVVQRIPTFRFQYQTARGTTEFHRDADYHHPVQSVNCVVPLTEMRNTTAIRAEVVPWTQVYEVLTGDPGEVLIFHGSLCRHGTPPNQEGSTRVSFDFRFAQRAHLPRGQVTVRHRMPLIVGAYYQDIPR